MARRITGLYGGGFWLAVSAAMIPVHVLWFRAIRRSALVLFVVGLLVMVGMWGDHFMELVVTQHHDFLPSSQAFYVIGVWAVATFAGTIGLFGMLTLVSLRYVPVASIVESRLLAHQQTELSQHA
jgi:molybdopterin-containing oxidoreductase family membrane subunit